MVKKRVVVLSEDKMICWLDDDCESYIIKDRHKKSIKSRVSHWVDRMLEKFFTDDENNIR